MITDYTAWLASRAAKSVRPDVGGPARIGAELGRRLDAVEARVMSGGDVCRGYIIDTAGTRIDIELWSGEIDS